MEAFTYTPRGRVRLTVDLSRLTENYRRLAARLSAEGAAAIAVVKANAYGHGEAPVAAALFAAGVRRFAVSSLEEGLRLRAALPTASILVLGYVPPPAAPDAAAARLTLSVGDLAYAKTVSSCLRGRRLAVEVKLNTGMNRWGFPTSPRSLGATVRAILSLSSCRGLVPVGLFSHLAAADEPHSPLTARQLARFRAARAALAARGLALPAHLSATAALLTVGALGLPFARLGLSLFGYAPVPAEGLLPVGRLECDIGAAYTVEKGETVGYGGEFCARRRERIGILPIGYADGLPRSASGGLVRVGGVLCPLIGRISMDAAAVLLTGAPPRARTATLFGECPEDLPRLAAAAGTIPHELLSGLGSRIQREYRYGNTIGYCHTE